MFLGTKRGGGPTAAVLLLLVCSYSQAAKIELPKKVEGESGTPIKISAVTDGKIVKWVSLTKGLSVFPTELLKDSKTIVVFAKSKGSYKVLAYTSDAEGPSEPSICHVVVDSDPDPIPPVPGPTDPLTKELLDLYKAETDPKKEEYITKLVQVYKQIPKFIEETTTVGELKATIRKTIDSLIPREALEPIRKRLQVELTKSLPIKADTIIDKKSMEDVFEKLTLVLEKVK